ncbi:hypothetical protein [Christiangramia sp.]|uniref:hypothetical protein n=1 Tax=Christiangramia sp. TaxID=1931228 RepID=UPI002626D02D|nr:hypothetical protein [Christiangramia sp.]
MSHPTNQMYVTENRLSSEGNVATAPPPPRVRKSEIEHKSDIPRRSAEAESDPGSITGLALREKKAKTLKVEREAELHRLKIQKMQGELMPIDLVERTQTINIQSIFRSFESASENIASIYNERLGGDRASLAEMITRMRKELERAIRAAEEKSKEEIKGLMAEYAATRRRGEKK